MVKFKKLAMLRSTKIIYDFFYVIPHTSVPQTIQANDRNVDAECYAINEKTTISRRIDNIFSSSVFCTFQGSGLFEFFLSY